MAYTQKTGRCLFNYHQYWYSEMGYHIKKIDFLISMSTITDYEPPERAFFKNLEFWAWADMLG